MTINKKTSSSATRHTRNVEPGLFQNVSPQLGHWGFAFITAKKAEGLSKNSLTKNYIPSLKAFLAFCSTRGVNQIEAIDAQLIREFLINLGKTHNPGGVHGFYRVVKTWLRWYEAESAPDGWRNPIRRVKAPKVPELPLDAVPLDQLTAMVRPADVRDRAILLTLLDTGLRASELVALDLADFDASSGLLTVRHGKGGKVRYAPLGASARQAVCQYLEQRKWQCPALFCTAFGTRLSYWGLRQIVRRMANSVGLKEPGLHNIRRAFAIGMLRAGTDLLTLSRLMGHSNLDLLARYAKQSTADIRAAVERASLADRL